MSLNFLDFEQPIAELEAKIDSLTAVSRQDEKLDINIDEEVHRLREKSVELTRKIFADQKVAVALHEVNTFAQRGVFAQRSGQGFGRRRGVVADPVFKNVAEQKEFVVVFSLSFQKPQKPEHGLFIAAGKMQVGNENGTRQGRHFSDTADAGSLERLGEFESRKLHFR